MISLFRIDREYVNLALGRAVEIQPVDFAEFAEFADRGRFGELPDTAGIETSLPGFSEAPASCGFLQDADFSDAAYAEEVSELEREGLVEMLRKSEEAQAVLESAEMEAEQIISAADLEAEEILKTANEQAEEVFKEARQKGRDEGYEVGLEEGRLVYEEKAKKDDENLALVLAELYNGLENAKIGLEDEVLKLSTEILRKIVKFSDDAEYEPFMPMLKNAMKQVRLGGKIYLRVSSEQYERFFSSGSAQIELDGGITVEAAVIKDVSMSPGDVIIDTDGETVNAGFDTQLKQLEIVFKQHNHVPQT